MKKIYKKFMLLVLFIILILLTGCESDFFHSAIDIKQSDTQIIDSLTPKNNSHYYSSEKIEYIFYNKTIYVTVPDGIVTYSVKNMSNGNIKIYKYYLVKENNTWHTRKIIQVLY